MIHKCNDCEYQSPYKANYRRHIENKHGIKQPMSTTHSISNNVTQQTGSGAEQTVSSQPENEKHSNLQEESVDQLYENIGQWQKAYETLKLQHQQEEKVTTSDDGRPSHVSIQLFDKCCKGLTDYMHYCQGLINLCQRVHTEKEQQLDRFCTAWEDLKRERDTFGKEINRRDCCGDGYLDERFARKLRRKCWGSEH